MSAPEPAVLAIDLGTTQVKAGVFDVAGRSLGIGHVPHAIHHPRPGWAEQDPEAWWSGVVDATRSALATTRGGSAPRVAAVSVVGQGPTAVAVDGAGRAVRPAITWMDVRAARESRDLEAALGVSGWELRSLPHERWVARHEPAVHDSVRWWLSAHDWLVLRLSGRAVASSPGGAGRFGSLVVSAGADPERHAPEVTWGTPVDTLARDVAAELGLDPDVLVVSGGNDALASFYGAGMCRSGDAIDTGGTSGGFGIYWDRALDIPGAYGAPAALPGLWLYGGAMSATGKSLEWLSGLLDPTERDVPRLLQAAAATPPGADGLVFLPYLAGERSPIWDDAARGVFAGLTLAHGRGHLARAVLEGAACSLRHVAEPIVAAGIRVRAMTVSGGTARSDLWNQIKADITGFTVAVPEVPETALLGAAMLAAVGSGLTPDLDSAMAAMCRVVREVTPSDAVRARYDELYGVYRDLYPATAPLIHRLAGLDAVDARPQAPEEGA